MFPPLARCYPLIMDPYQRESMLIVFPFLRLCQGHDFKLRFTSDRVLEKSLSMKDVLLPGLNIDFNSEFTPDTGKVNVGVTSTFGLVLELVCVSVNR